MYSIQKTATNAFTMRPDPQSKPNINALRLYNAQRVYSARPMATLEWDNSQQSIFKCCNIHP